MKHKYILALDLIVVVGTLIVIAGIAGYGRPLVISPLDDFTTTNASVLFSFESPEKVPILIDDNIEFTSPEKIYIRDNLVINLKPGEYYWKIDNGFSEEVRKLNIESEVDLKLKKLESGYEVVNSGNTRLNVDIYDGDTLVGGIVLSVDESKEVSGTKFIGGQDE